MPGTSTSGVKRLRAWVAALVAGVAAVLAAPGAAQAAMAPSSAIVTVRAEVSGVATAGVGSADRSGAFRQDGADAAAVPGTAPAVAPAATVGQGFVGQGVAGAAVSGQAAGSSADLSVESVSAPPAAVPWIVVALIFLVVAGAARAYSRSPQRAAVRTRRATR